MAPFHHGLLGLLPPNYRNRFWLCYFFTSTANGRTFGFLHSALPALRHENLRQKPKQKMRLGALRQTLWWVLATCFGHGHVLPLFLPRECAECAERPVCFACLWPSKPIAKVFVKLEPHGMAVTPARFWRNAVVERVVGHKVVRNARQVIRAEGLRRCLQPL